MRKMLIRKINSCAGESIAESLVSILVVAVASIMFAGMVTASSRIIETSSDWMQEYYQAVSEINARQASDEVKVTRGNAKVSIEGVEKNETVTTYTYEAAGVEIISYVPPTPKPSSDPAIEPVAEPSGE